VLGVSNSAVFSPSSLSNKGLICSWCFRLQ
jgi:hypothetical protein